MTSTARLDDARWREARRSTRLALVGVLVTLVPAVATALDRQGSAHGGRLDVTTHGLDVSGTLLLGVSAYNPTYAARPDNTGLALFRYAGHFDLDLLGERLSIPLDLNTFTDRTVGGPGVMKPSELDVIAGLTSTNRVGLGAIEAGVRVENDRPIHHGSYTQSYADFRVRYLYSLASRVPAFGRALRGGDLSGWLTLGTFFYNPTYAARPDNTGLALLRYGVHAELSVLHDWLSLGIDTNMFTDRLTNAVRPSELDLAVDLILHRAPVELHGAYERDMPVGRHGLVQQFVSLLAGWSFDVRHPPPPPMTDRYPIHSP